MVGRPVPLGSSWTPPFGVGAPAITGNHQQTWQNMANINTFASASSASSGSHQSQENIFNLQTSGSPADSPAGSPATSPGVGSSNAFLGSAISSMSSSSSSGSELLLREELRSTKLLRQRLAVSWFTRHQEVSHECNCSTHPSFAR